MTSLFLSFINLFISLYINDYEIDEKKTCPLYIRFLIIKVKEKRKLMVSVTVPVVSSIPTSSNTKLFFNF